MSASSPETLSGGEEADQDAQEAANSEMRELLDQALQEKVQRLQDWFDKGFHRNLPDGGKKFSISLRAARSELARRQAARSAPRAPSRRTPPPRRQGQQGEPDDGRCERIAQSRCAGSSDLASDSNENSGITKSVFMSAFGCKEIPSTGPGKPNSSLENVGKLHKVDESCKPGAQATCMSHKVPCVDNSTNSKNMNAGDHYIDNCDDSICEVALTTQKRKGDASGFSMRLRSRRKVDEVVLLDGDAHHSEPVEKTSSKCDAMKIYYPSREHHNAVDLSRDDIKCLEPESLMSSPVMNFYIMYLQRPMSSISRLRGKYHIFNTYFFKKLEALQSKEDKVAYFLKLRRWWKGIDIFRESYIFLPVHADTHWSLVIICMPAKEDRSGPIVLHLDSLNYHKSRLIFSTVERFLKHEWKYLNENGSLEEFPIHDTVWKNLPRKIEKRSIAVPQQGNEYDCGLFVLYYMRRFIEDAPERLHKKDLSMFGKGWFQPEEASALREEMQSLLFKLFEEAKPENSRTEPTTSQVFEETKPENNTTEPTASPLSEEAKPTEDRAETTTSTSELFEEANPKNNTREPVSEHPLKAISAEITLPDPLEGTSTQPTTFEHPLECS